MSDSSTNWYRDYLKLRFFGRILRLLKYRGPDKRGLPSGRSRALNLAEMVCRESKKEDSEAEGESDRAAVLMPDGDPRIGGESGRDGAGEEGRESEWAAVLQRSVKMLHFGSWREKEAAAGEIKRLAADGDTRKRKLMAELGVIPPLVGMVGSEVVARGRVAVQALLELANGTCTSKARMVEAGILTKLPDAVVAEESARHELAQLVLSLSSLTNAQFPINPSTIIPFVLSILDSDSSADTKELCLGTLLNLSTIIDNSAYLATHEVISTLLRFSSLKQTSEKALATLGNLAVTLPGKKALEGNPSVPESLIEIMAREEEAKSQELCAYVLMVLAHQSSDQRLKMAKAGIVTVLLEVALLGPPLAQRRALKLLQWFKDERNTRVAPHSGPQSRRVSIGSLVNQRVVNEEKKIMKKMVKQSLYKNMETITRRATGFDKESDSNYKFLVTTSSSKSLPY